MAAIAARPVVYTKLNADQSAVELARRIRARVPFFFFRYGDGALECMAGREGGTRDGEPYTPALGAVLDMIWMTCAAEPEVVVGDWQSASFDAASEGARYVEEYERLIAGARPREWVHFEALLLMRPSRALVDFYRAVKRDPRRKVFMGPAGNAGAAKMLGAEFVESPMGGLMDHTGRLTDELITREFDVLLYGAGMAGHIPVANCFEAHPERTYVDLGSAMDPLFRGRSRRQQLDTGTARRLFRGLLAA